jgi:hypothetical protein
MACCRAILTFETSVRFVTAGAKNLIRCLNQSSWWDKGQCRPPDGLAIIASQFSPYLYPFTIEYSILVGESHDSEEKNVLTFQ